LLNNLKFEFLIINKEITQLKIELDKRNGIIIVNKLKYYFIDIKHLYNVFTSLKTKKKITTINKMNRNLILNYF
jgi:hypothetical protein